MPKPRRGRRRKRRQAVSRLRVRQIERVRPSLSASQMKHCGVLVWGERGQPAPAFELPITYGKLSLPYACTLIWVPGTKVSQQVVTQGFARLLSPQDTSVAWEILAMLVDRNLLASSVGSKEERARTLKEVGDLRLPVYDVRALWMRRTDAAKRLVARWAREVEQGADKQHAFLRALYGEGAMLCTLPPGWQGV